MPRLEALPTVLAVVLGSLLLGVAFWSFETDPMWAIISFVLVYDPDVHAAWKAGVSRLGLTIFGSLLAMALVFALGLHKWLLPASLAITALLCWAFLESRVAWRIVLVTVALIIGSSLLQPSAGRYIAVTRSIEVTVGSLLAAAFALGAERFANGTRGGAESGKP
jgi:uncharacterized membrane protein YccC